MSAECCWASAWSILTFFGTLIALLFVLTTLYYIAKNFFVFFLAEPLGLTVKFTEMGEWAVVTGSTDGIGKGYAFDLARRGCNIVLISRTEEKLRKVAKEIELKYGVKTKIIVADFASGEEIYPKIKQELSGLKIGTLVNNVGMMGSNPEYFDKVPEGEEFYIKMIRCNIISQTIMTRMIVPEMLVRKKGVIINLSSVAGALPLPLIAVYSASKAYNHFLSTCLEQEYRSRGVIVQSIQPCVVATNMSLNPSTNVFILDAMKYARSCLNTVGFFVVSNGHPSHAIQNWIFLKVPFLIFSKISVRVMEWVRLFQIEWFIFEICIVLSGFLSAVKGTKNSGLLFSEHFHRTTWISDQELWRRMPRRFDIGCYLLLFVILPSSAHQCGKPVIEPSVLSERRILGGEEAIAGSWPWQVRIGERVDTGGVSFFCGGSVLNPLFIITAGHCFPGNNFGGRKFVIRVAEHNMTSSDSTERDYNVLMIIKHPNYTSVGSPANDVTLLRLVYPITFTDHISNICLPDSGHDPEPGTQCVVTGWGRFMDQFSMVTTQSLDKNNHTINNSAEVPSTPNHTGGNHTPTAPSPALNLSVANISAGSTNFYKNDSVMTLLTTRQSAKKAFRWYWPVFFRQTTPKKTINKTITNKRRSTLTPTSSFFNRTDQNSTSEILADRSKDQIYSAIPLQRRTTWRTSKKRPVLHSLPKTTKKKPQLRMPPFTSHSEVLQQAVIPIFDRKECSNYWKPLLRETMICTFPSKDYPRKEPCKGDSGGPLVCKSNTGEDEVWRLEGIISFGAGCGGGRPAVYTRVASYVRWIERVAKYPNPLPLLSLMSLASNMNGRPVPATLSNFPGFSMDFPSFRS